MASGRKHASFRHRSQSDNGVIIELTPPSVGGYISPGLIPVWEPRSDFLQRTSWAAGEVPSSACGRVQASGPSACARRAVGAGPACGSSVARCIRGISDRGGELAFFTSC